ncbi:MAG: RNA polymerase sigma factor [Planctomycetota bacterium]
MTRAMMQGDAEALTQFYKAQFEMMLREAKRCCGRDESTCLDLVQEAMLKAIKCIKPLDSQAGVNAWSRAVVKSVTWDWLRKQQRRANKTTVISQEQLHDQPDRQPISIQSDPLDAAARLVWLEHELATLPPQLQSMISLRFRLGWSLQKIGAKFGLKTGAVDGRIRRAVERLKQKASQEYHDD